MQSVKATRAKPDPSAIVQFVAVVLWGTVLKTTIILFTQSVSDIWNYIPLRIHMHEFLFTFPHEGSVVQQFDLFQRDMFKR